MNALTPTASTSQSTQQTFANVARKQATDIFPSKEQAILMNSIDGIKIKEYITCIGNIVGPKNVLFASRISNNRVCIYVQTKELVDTIIKNHQTVKIENHEINIRRLITPAKRLILSNVCPSIPHNIIEDNLKLSGLKLVSPINFLRVGMQETEYAHVLSFRRQTYISPDDNQNIPDNILIKYEDIEYRIFISEDIIKCFICKKRDIPPTNATTT